MVTEEFEAESESHCRGGHLKNDCSFCRLIDGYTPSGNACSVWDVKYERVTPPGFL
jgi:hypothetical protein